MLRYDRQTKPGLVALYDIRPGNGAGPFLQPRSPHGAYLTKNNLQTVTNVVSPLQPERILTSRSILIPMPPCGLRVCKNRPVPFPGWM